MSKRASTPSQPMTASRRTRLYAIVGAVIVLLTVLRLLLGKYTDFLWFQQLGFSTVFWRSLGYAAAVWAGAFLLAAVPLWLVLRGLFSKSAHEYSSPVLRQYQERLQGRTARLALLLPLFFGVLAASPVAASWKQVVLAFTAEPFGVEDPIFGHDVSLYVMVLPLLNIVTSLLLNTAMTAFLAVIVWNYVSGHIAIRPQRIVVSRSAQVETAVAAAAVLVVVGIRFWLARYQQLSRPNGQWAGALYTDVNSVIPADSIMAFASVLAGLLFIAAARTGRWKMPVVGVAALTLTGVIAGVVYPWGIQRYVVTPSMQSKESEYIQHNIDATRSAYGLDRIKVKQYDATTKASAAALSADRASIENVRLLDPNVVSNAFAQLQQYRQYYQFPEQLNVDRYTVNGKTEDTVIAVRELNIDGAPDSWFNRHLVYTHGYGVVAAYGSQVGSDGKPVFMQSGIPSSGVLGKDGSYEPRIYFGEKSPDYSIVGAPAGQAPQEIDRPQNADSDSTESKSTFSGNGGPSLSNPVNRLAYALKFSSTNILLSNGIHKESQILYNRDPRDRVAEVAPYLTVDKTAYPAVVDGRVTWIVDAYTATDKYPYSTPTQLQSATSDTNTAEGTRQALSATNANYLRNSVKATVDAYDGSVTLYSWDEDPLLKAWKRLYPGTVRDRSEMSADLLSHVRYPQDQFKVQREILGRYHVTDSGRLFNNDDAWVVPTDPTSSAKALQPPYYMSLRMPGETSAAFSLTSPFISKNVKNGQQRDVMFGFLSANGDAGNVKGQVSPEYGSLTLLELPRDTVVPGPGQAFTKFNSDPTVSKELNLLRTGASEVISGNLLSLPVGDGILYVQPVYVQATGGIKLPTLRRVLVNFGDQVGFAPTLDQALEQIFQGYASGKSSPSSSTTTPAPKGQTTPTEVRDALEKARKAIKAGEEALAKGDFAAYGKAQEDLKKALEEAVAAEEKAAGTSR